MNPFKAIGSVFKKLFSGLASFLSKENIDKALEIADHIKPLVEFALPYSKMLATATPTRADDRIIAIVESMGRKFDEVLSEPNPDVRRGLLQGIVRRGIAIELRGRIIDHGSVKIGPFTLKNFADIAELLPGDYLDAAVQAAWTFFVKPRQQGSQLTT